jgi:hypothetical protein
LSVTLIKQVREQEAMETKDRMEKQQERATGGDSQELMIIPVLGTKLI